MDVDVAQREHSSIKRYASAFSNILIIILPINLLSMKNFASKLNWTFSLSDLGFVSSNSIAAPSAFDTLKVLKHIH